MTTDNKPIRVSNKDLQAERKNRKGYKHFPKGSCHLLHPLLQILDKRNDCKLWYELEHKIFYVIYGDDKSIMTPEVSTIVDVINKSEVK